MKNTINPTKNASSIALLNTNYSKERNIEDISNDCVTEFVNEMNFDSFADFYVEVENMETKKLKWEDRKVAKLNKLITFVYYSFKELPRNSSFSCDRGNSGYAHNFCNKKVKKIKA